MKKYIYMAVAAIAALASCSDNDIVENVTTGNDSEMHHSVFTATMEGVGGLEDAQDTRAIINNWFYFPAFEVKDQISINGKTYFAETADENNSDGMQSFCTFAEDVQTKEVRPTFVSGCGGRYEYSGADKLVDAEGTSTVWFAEHKNRKTFGVFEYAVRHCWWIIVKTDSPVRLRAIKLWNGNLIHEWPGFRWRRFYVYGSASENGPWESIGSFYGLDMPVNTYGSVGTFEVNAADEYQYYRVLVAEAAEETWYIDDDDVLAIMQMSDMKFVYEDKAKTGLQINAPYNAYFPASLYDGTTLTLPSKTDEFWDTFKFNMPMYASSTNNNLAFKNLCDVLKISVSESRGDQQSTWVERIRVSSANKAVSGPFTVENNTAVLTNPDDYTKDYIIHYARPVEVHWAGFTTDFYVPIPAQTYQELKIELDPDGKGFTKSMTTTPGKDITIERNMIYPIDFHAN